MSGCIRVIWKLIFFARLGRFRKQPKKSRWGLKWIFGSHRNFQLPKALEVEAWLLERKEYNQVRPHSAKGYRPPTAEAKMLATLTL